MSRVRNCLIEGVSWINSPRYHMNLIDIDSFLIQDLEIYVDVLYQNSLMKLLGSVSDFISGLPFPLNTDGIDPAGTNITVRNVKITNFDDAVVVKPAN